MPCHDDSKKTLSRSPSVSAGFRLAITQHFAPARNRHIVRQQEFDVASRMAGSLRIHENKHAMVHIRVCQHIEFRALYFPGSPGVGSRGPYTYPAPRLGSRASASTISGLSSPYGHYELRRLSPVAPRLQLQPGESRGPAPTSSTWRTSSISTSLRCRTRSGMPFAARR